MCYPVLCPVDLCMTISMTLQFFFLKTYKHPYRKHKMWLTILTDRLLNDFSSLVGKAKPRPYTDALQSAAACNFQLNSFKCNKTMQEVLADCGPGFPHS